MPYYNAKNDIILYGTHLRKRMKLVLCRLPCVARIEAMTVSNGKLPAKSGSSHDLHTKDGPSRILQGFMIVSSYICK